MKKASIGETGSELRSYRGLIDDQSTVSVVDVIPVARVRLQRYAVVQPFDRAEEVSVQFRFDFARESQTMTDLHRAMVAVGMR